MNESNPHRGDRDRLQHPGQHRRNRRRRLAVGIGQPGVHRNQSYFRAISNQDENKRQLEDVGIQLIRHTEQLRHIQRRIRIAEHSHG